MARLTQVKQLTPEALLSFIEAGLPAEGQGVTVPSEQIAPHALQVLVQAQCRKVFEEMELSAKTELEELYTFVTLLAKLVFHYAVLFSREDELRTTAMTAILQIYIRCRMAHQITAALLFLNSGDDSDKSDRFRALNVHQALMDVILMPEQLDRLIPADQVNEYARKACDTVLQKARKFPPTAGKQLNNMTSLTSYLNNQALIPSKWGADMHDTSGVQQAFILLGRHIESEVRGMAGSPALNPVLAKIQEDDSNATAQDLGFMIEQIRAFFAMDYPQQSVFTSRKQLQKAREEASYATVKLMTKEQLEFYILKILNSRVQNREAMRDKDLKRSLRLRAAHSIYRHIDEKQKSGVHRQPILARQITDLSHQAVDYLTRQFHRRPLNLMDLSRARRDFMMLDNLMLAHDQLEAIPGFTEISQELSQSDINDDADLIQMALEESDIKIFEQMDQWLNEQLLPFLDQRGGQKHAALKVAVNACEHTFGKMMNKLGEENYQLSIRLGDALPADGEYGEQDAVAGEEAEFDEFATPVMTKAHLDCARLAGAAARMIKLVMPEESHMARDRVRRLKEFRLVNNETLFKYSYKFFHRSLKAFTADDGEDLVRWHHLAEQTRIYGQLLEIMDTDFLYNESPRCLGAVEEAMRERLTDNSRPPRTPAEAESFIKLAIIVQKIARNNSILDVFARIDAANNVTMPIIALLLMDKQKQPVNLKMLRTWVTLTFEVEKIFIRNTMSVNEQKLKPIEQHIVARRLDTFLRQARC